MALLDSNYATSSKLKVGSTVTIAKTKFTVVGIVSTAGREPLGRRVHSAGPGAGARHGSMKGDVNTIYVAANSAQNIDTVSKSISTTLPKTTVTNQSDLAKELTGSVSSASSLASNLGKWLAIAVLVAAFLLASLLTMSAVSRRVREFGTLKALGWTSRRVVGQVVGEAIVIGVIGGIVGVGLGYLGSALVGHFSPPLTASLGPTTGCATPGGAQRFGWRRRRFGGGGTAAAVSAVAARWRVRRDRRWRRLPPGRRDRGQRSRAPDRAGDGRRDRGRGAAGHRRRPDRRRVRRLAGGPAAAGHGAGEGRMSTGPLSTSRPTGTIGKSGLSAAIQGESSCTS